MVKLKKVPTKKARFIEHNERTDWMNIAPGDVVVYKEGSDYEIEIDDKLYFRIRQDELIYVEEDA